MLKFKIVEEIGTIKFVNGNIATVILPKKNACEGCTMKICKPGQQTMEIKALNAINALPGQKVRVTFKSNLYLKGSIIAYGIPAIALLAGAIAGKEIFSHLIKKYNPDLISAISGFIACFISILFIKLWSLKTNGNVKPVIEEILENNYNSTI
ncbi:MAG: SoxR reducing system RseC family protein [Nitrospirae bacterium]|jgi:sigma-E factor negative regulatory protein RseC|nr:SoxR reducing system RseC family protein [Nitrospirota bacterium]